MGTACSPPSREAGPFKEQNAEGAEKKDAHLIGQKDHGLLLVLEGGSARPGLVSFRVCWVRGGGPRKLSSGEVGGAIDPSLSARLFWASEAPPKRMRVRGWLEANDSQGGLKAGHRFCYFCGFFLNIHFLYVWGSCVMVSLPLK